MLYNNFQYNTADYNALLDADTSVAGTDLAVFNGFSLADGTYMIITDVDDNAPARELIGGKIPGDDGEYVTGDLWRGKTIVLKGWVKTADWTTMEAYLETIKKNLRIREKYLDIIRNSVVRRYVASWINPDTIFQGRSGHDVNVVKFEIDFKASNPNFGADKTYTSSVYAVSSPSPTNQSISQTGTYKSKGVFSIVYDAASSVTVVQVYNITTLEQIQYTGTVAAGDVLIFDGENKVVTKNNVKVAFQGSFPHIEVGTNNISIVTTGTSWTATATIAFKNAYL